MEQSYRKSSRSIPYESGDKYWGSILTGKCFRNKHRQKIVEFICKCGNISWTGLYELVSGKTKSCGCMAKMGRPTHGQCKHPLYKTFSDMKSRCYNDNYDGYCNYGYRGIIICNEWINSPEVFFKWAENNGWYKGCGLTLDRINNDGNYTPLNCKWSSKDIQSRNKRTNINIEAFGETKCLTDWVADDRCKVSFNQVIYRLNKMGLDPEAAISRVSERSIYRKSKSV